MKMIGNALFVPAVSIIGKYSGLVAMKHLLDAYIVVIWTQFIPDKEIQYG
jgi:hypothetical protein